MPLDYPLPTAPPRTQFDVRLNGRVDFTPAPKMHPAERQRLEAELGCLQREAAQVQRGIAHLECQLGNAAA